MSPPAMLTGALPLTAFCLLTERAPAHCSVSAFWTPIWAPPAPPLPELPLSLLFRSRPTLPSLLQSQSEPMFCSCSCFCVVSASLDAFASDSELASCDPEVLPSFPSRRSTYLGALPLTAFCLLTERAPAHCSVSAFWIPICAAPGPPQPSLQEEPPTFCSWSCFCVVSASLDAFASDSELAVWFARAQPGAPVTS